jgi:hypothetical protein
VIEAHARHANRFLYAAMRFGGSLAGRRFEPACCPRTISDATIIAPTINQADSAGDLLVRPGQHLLLVTGKLAHVLLQLRQLLGELCY